ncbi:hypothetical protein L6164_011658 [Bauhinia variegata]|uniref:Uncharacterized protein n=1 Tax=Bauhinia variegata TaxID=167791 RepID=A0ACB9P6N1_BAUVA|nr:hypothetical protein L6164_011658 [Bauhinia variegata]
MEGQPTKRRRVYSLEPNKVVQSMFASRYVNYLVPALSKIKEESSSEDDNRCCDLNNAVKYEVDKAMVFSAQGFAWSNALKLELQTGTKAGRSTASIVETEASDGSSGPRYQKEMVAPVDFTANPSSISESKKLVKCSKVLPAEIKKSIETDENEKEDIGSRLGNLKRLLPGGEDMCEEEIFGELGSYISCLQMQVNILRCLADQIRY